VTGEIPVLHHCGVQYILVYCLKLVLYLCKGNFKIPDFSLISKEQEAKSSKRSVFSVREPLLKTYDLSETMSL
jgi:hypothetical protein